MRFWLTSPLLATALVFTQGCKPDETGETGEIVETGNETGIETGSETGTGSDWEYCPSWEFDAATAGTYTVIVSTYACEGETQANWAYKLEVNGSTSTTLAVVDDDADAFIIHPISTTAVGTGTLTDDTDADTDADGFTGELVFQRTYDTDLQCNVNIDLLGTEAYVGDCADCTFGFKVDPTVTTDSSTADCEKDFTYYALTFQEGAFTDTTNHGALTQNWLGFAATADGYYGYGEYIDSLVVGATYNSDDYTDYGFQTYLATSYLYHGTDGDVDYPTGSTSSLTGMSLAFNIALEGSEEEPVFGEDCEAAAGDEALAPAGGLSATGTLACDNSENTIVDVYSFTAAAGATIKVSVDTTDGANFGDGLIEIRDPNGCVVGGSDDAFDCTEHP